MSRPIGHAAWPPAHGARRGRCATLTNIAKHAKATKAKVSIARAGNRLVVEVMDNGLGGADPERGTGLRGLADRIAAVGGWMRLLSPPGGPTTLMVELPCAS